MKENILLVYCTLPNSDEASTIAQTLIDKKLAACCNIIPGITSIYHWQGNVEESKETLLLIKTSQKKYDQLEKEIKMLHSYSVPEIIATKIEAGSQAYIDWVLQSIEKTG